MTKGWPNVHCGEKVYLSRLEGRAVLGMAPGGYREGGRMSGLPDLKKGEGIL